MESSRKQQICDTIITLGKNPNSKVRMGIMNLCKNRRGSLDSCKYIGTDEGQFYACSDMLYAKYRNYTTRTPMKMNILQMEDDLDSIVTDKSNESTNN